jgi:hypothetical protein
MTCPPWYVRLGHRVATATPSRLTAPAGGALSADAAISRLKSSNASTIAGTESMI